MHRNVKIDIPIQKLGDMPCYDQALVCYAKVHNRRYEMIFGGSWGFEYREEASPKKIGERIRSRAVLNMNYLKRYHGIEVIKKEVREDENLLTILEDELVKGNPVMIFVSTYYFPWNEHYKKFENNLPHAMLAVGVDWEMQCIYCVDNMYQQQNAKLTFADLSAGNNGKYWLIRCLPEYEKDIDVEEVFHYSISKLKRNSEELQDILDIYRLAEAMRKDFDFKNEIDNTHGGIWIEPIIFNIGGIMADRANYARLLDYIVEQREDSNIKRAKENMDKIALDWNQIRGLLIKGYYMEDGKSLVERISCRLEKVAELEEKTVDILENWRERAELPDTKMCMESKEPELDKLDYIPLQEIFNNQCFGIYNDKPSVAGIGGMRYFFYWEERVKEENWKLHNMSFYHRPISGRESDSVKCNGQVLRVLGEEYDVIMLMGYGDLSSFEDELEIQYEDGTCEAVKIEVPDSCIPNPYIKNSMLWNGRCGFIDDIEEHAWDVGIYAKKYSITRKPLTGIKLPVCPNIILLAVSLGKYKR